MENAVTLKLSHDEALVLSVLFARFEKENHLTLKHNAEFIALSHISRQIDKSLVEPFQADYVSLVAAAQARVSEGYEGLAPGVEP
jgi:hypothetical protein